MALTTNNINMIKAIAENDLSKAKMFAAASINEDSSKKNEYTKQYLPKLENNTYSLERLIPAKSKGFLLGFMPGEFDVSQYYLPEEERKLFEQIKKVKKLSYIMEEKNIHYRNATLLYGASGTGKTMFARYVAHKFNLPYLYCNFSSVVDSLVGATSKNMANVFEVARTIPCVLVLDEVDCVALKRHSSHGEAANKEFERSTITLMQELDRLPNHVILIACTNVIDMLDKALIRRFSVKHEIKHISETERVALAKQFVKATNSSDIISDEMAEAVARKSLNAAELINNLSVEIAESLYATIEDMEDLAEGNTYKVTVSWDDVIEAASEEEAMMRYQDAWKYDITKAKVFAKKISA